MWACVALSLYDIAGSPPERSEETAEVARLIVGK